MVHLQGNYYVLNMCVKQCVLILGDYNYSILTSHNYTVHASRAHQAPPPNLQPWLFHVPTPKTALSFVSRTTILSAATALLGTDCVCTYKIFCEQYTGIYDDDIIISTV